MRVKSFPILIKKRALAQCLVNLLLVQIVLALDPIQPAGQILESEKRPRKREWGGREVVLVQLAEEGLELSKGPKRRREVDIPEYDPTTLRTDFLNFEALVAATGQLAKVSFFKEKFLVQSY